jgi:hypothetical protein
MRILAPITLAMLALALLLEGCGGGTSGGVPVNNSNPLSGNWQVNFLQQEPSPPTQLGASGFFRQSGNVISGTLEVPPSTQNGKCGGVASVTGSIDGQTVTLTINTSANTLTFTGTLGGTSQTMAGTYSGLGGGCFTRATSGTWNAQQIPALSGSFTGTLSSSTYMQALLGESVVPPIMVSGTLTQSSPSSGSSIVDVTGTITAVSYPCFTTANLSGTVSGRNVILSVYSYNGVNIGTLGAPATPATIVIGANGFSLVGTNPGQGLDLFSGSCPKIQGNSSDSAQVTLTFP